MRILLACEFYYPSVGGVQEVMRQIAERLVATGHDVTVATSYLRERKFKELNGVRIRQFKASGKLATGMTGKIDAYRKFVTGFDADAMLVMAAQQWTFDALWPELDRIRARKILIPCGFSCLYEPAFAEYFAQLPAVLRKFDHLVFNAERYRDIDFARAHGLTELSVLPNGVSELEFEQPPDPGIRARLGISDDDFVFLTIGNPINAKGHREIAEAFARLDTRGRPATLIQIANWRRDSGPRSSSRALQRISRMAWYAYRAVEITVTGGFSELLAKARRFTAKLRDAKARAAAALDAGRGGPGTLDDWIREANSQPGKRVLCTDLARPDLIQAYMAADLFVFASNIEYSPLVLFEAAAAGTPFLSVPVGNAEEIVRWTGGGLICPAAKDEFGYTRVDPKVLALEMRRCMDDPGMLAQLGARGKESWRKHFTWKVMVPRYDAILRGRSSDAVPEASAQAGDGEVQVA